MNLNEVLDNFPHGSSFFDHPVNRDTSHMVMSWATLALPSALSHSASTGGKTLL